MNEDQGNRSFKKLVGVKKSNGKVVVEKRRQLQRLARSQITRELIESTCNVTKITRAGFGVKIGKEVAGRSGESDNKGGDESGLHLDTPASIPSTSKSAREEIQGSNCWASEAERQKQHEQLSYPSTSKLPAENIPRKLSPINAFTYLVHMRPDAEFILSAKPCYTCKTFYVGVEVDGKSYVGCASTENDALIDAARLACKDLFDINF